MIHRRVSDLQSCWLGQTEKAIAAAFCEAEHEDAALLFDEADSFLRDRKAASRSWESTQVNEFLQQLECFRGVVACTTNLVHDLDEASVRRFVFKIPFGFLSPAQAQILFESAFTRHLGSAPRVDERPTLRSALARMGRLAPGDFAAVARRFTALGKPASTDECLSELHSEARSKRKVPGVIAGFNAG